MTARRFAPARALAVLSAGLVGACALIVGPPDGHRLFEPGETADAAIDSTSEGHAPDVDGSLDDVTSAETGDEGAHQEAGVADGSLDDANGQPCQVDGTNLVENGDFSEGASFWQIVSGGGAIIDGGPGELCISVPDGSQAVLGWTLGVPLASATPYTFSYCARATQQAVAVLATVGHSTSPFTPDYQKNDGVVTSWQDFAHRFSVTSADTSAGLSFTLTSPTAQDVCFEAVGIVDDED